MADDPLTEAIDNAIAEQDGFEDSFAPQAEETPEAEADEQPEEPEEIDEELSEEDDEFDFDEEDLEDFDEEDFEEIEDDEDDASDDEADDEEAEESDELELSFDDLDPDMTVPVKVRGEELEVSLQELRDGYSREEDYTRDKQELREREQEVQQVYEQMRDWYESRASDPAGWVQEVITEESDDSPDVTLAQAIARSDNPTGLFARTFKIMAEAGQLDRELVEPFEDQLDLSGRAENAETEDRIARLERELQEERERREREQQQRQQQAQQQEIVEQYEQQWSNIVDQEGLEFDSAQDEFETKRDLLEFARKREIVNLEDAWSVMQYKQRGQQSKRKKKRKRSKKAREAAKRKKRKARAMNRKPKGGDSPPKRKKGDTDAAVKEAAREMGIL